MPRPRPISGFTLLELVLVLAILATLCAAVAPSLGGFGTGRHAEEAAARFVALTHWARSQAITDGVAYRLTLDPAAGEWWVSTDDGQSVADAESPLARRYNLPSGVTVEADLPLLDGLPAITFDPSGRGDTGTVRFRGPRGAETEVRAASAIAPFRVSTGGTP